MENIVFSRKKNGYLICNFGRFLSFPSIVLNTTSVVYILFNAMHNEQNRRKPFLNALKIMRAIPFNGTLSSIFLRTHGGILSDFHDGMSWFVILSIQIYCLDVSYTRITANTIASKAFFNDIRLMQTNKQSQ